MVRSMMSDGCNMGERECGMTGSQPGVKKRDVGDEADAGEIAVTDGREVEAVDV